MKMTKQYKNETEIINNIVDILLSDELSTTLAFNISEQFLKFYNKNPKATKFALIKQTNGDDENEY